MAAEDEVCGGDISVLPENCIANALSLTNPKDACRLSLVASNFNSAAQSNDVWERFLPPDYRDLVSRAANGADLFALRSKKDLYFYLCDHPVIIDEGAKSFALEKRSGKKCYMLSARSLKIVWGDDERYWRWSSYPGSRFSEVAELRSVCWLEICGKISAKTLSPNTNHAAYLVFKSDSNNFRGFDSQPINASVRISGQEAKTRTVYFDLNRPERPWNSIGPWRIDTDLHGNRTVPRRLDLFANRFRGGPRPTSNAPSESNGEYPKPRGDDWLEIELGEIFIGSGEVDDEFVEMSIMEVDNGHWKSGVIVLGIEIRPKKD